MSKKEADIAHLQAEVKFLQQEKRSLNRKLRDNNRRIAEWEEILKSDKQVHLGKDPETTINLS